MSRRGVYPGTFDPATVAHLAIADAAAAQRDLDVVVFTLSRVALAKEHLGESSARDRADRLRRIVATRPWAEVAVVDDRLIADIATGYDVVVMGADKWAQVNDPVFYGGSVTARDAALARLPELAIAPRGDVPLPERAALELPDWTLAVSSTAVRGGAEHWRA